LNTVLTDIIFVVQFCPFGVVTARQHSLLCRALY